MKKQIIITLLLALALSTIAPPQCSQCGCSGDDCYKPPSFKCDTGCNDGSPVNGQICVDLPDCIAPPTCTLPCIQPPVIKPPTICPPDIDTPDFCVTTIKPPSVIKPPTIVPPKPITPIVKPPTYIPPPPPCGIPTTNPVLPTGPVIQLPPTTPPNVPKPTLTNKFVLTFQYACRQQVDFGSCTGNVVWNNVIVLNIIPTNYNVNSVSIVVFAQVGKNSLQFSGTGVSDSYGLTVDNVKLVRDGTLANIVVNGQFEDPDVDAGWQIFNDITGWQGFEIEIGFGTIYNSQWTSQVVQLDGNRNFQITQTFFFNGKYQLVQNNHVNACDIGYSGKKLYFNLEFDWAVRTKGGINSIGLSSRANVLWNNKIVGSLLLTGSNTGVNHASFLVVLEQGDNVVQFDGTGLSDSYGITIDKVTLTAPYSLTNLIANGDFQVPALTPGTFIIQTVGFNGWSASQYEIGSCTIYNNAWGSGQCIELDPNVNVRYTQVIYICTQTYSNLIMKMIAYEEECQIAGTKNLAVNNANTQITLVQQKVDSIVKQKISIMESKFNTYLQTLYGNVCQQIKDVKADQTLDLHKFDCLSQQWKKHFGYSYEPDFQCTHADYDLKYGFCIVIKINGKVIDCKSDSGLHQLQIAPCTNFEGTYSQPRCGDKLFWRGSHGSNGKIHVTAATSCDC